MITAALATFIQQPKVLNNIYFETQRNGEKIVLLLRRDFITNTPWITTVILASLLPLLSFIVWPVVTRLLNTSAITITFSTLEIAVMLITFYLLVGYYVYLKFLEWFFTVLIITNHRVIDINFFPPFDRQSTQAQLEEIQDVRETQHGVFAVIFNYGTIYIQTAGTKQNISLNHIPRPQAVHNFIIELLHKPNRSTQPIKYAK